MSPTNGEYPLQPFEREPSHGHRYDRQVEHIQPERRQPTIGNINACTINTTVMARTAAYGPIRIAANAAPMR